MILETLLELREPDIIDSDDGLSPDEGRYCLLLEMRVAEICPSSQLIYRHKKNIQPGMHISKLLAAFFFYIEYSYSHSPARV